MKTLAIISEFNPFHNGHKYLLKKSKEITGADLAFTIMSGDFVQRGEPAIIDKFRRADVALEAGFDLVIEMPSFVSLQSASFFAKKNVEILDKLGISYLCFGIENISSEEFKKQVELIINNKENIDKLIKKYLDLGYSYTKSSYLSLGHILRDDSLLTSNNILAFEYIKAIKDLGSKISYVPVERISANNTDIEINDKTYASSTAIRNNIGEDRIKNLVPRESYKSLGDFKNVYKTYPRLNDFYPYLKYKFFIEAVDMKDKLCYEEGLENLFSKNLRKAQNFEDFIDISTSSRFTSSRIRRLSLNYLLENKISFNDIDIDFIKILACNKRAMEFLAKRDIKKVISKKDLEKLTNYEKIIFNANLRASNLYNIGLGRPIDYDYKKKFVLR